MCVVGVHVSHWGGLKHWPRLKMAVDVGRLRAQQGPSQKFITPHAPLIRLFKLCAVLAFTDQRNLHLQIIFARNLPGGIKLWYDFHLTRDRRFSDQNPTPRQF